MLERLDFWISMAVLLALAYAEVRPFRRTVRFLASAAWKRLTGLFVVMSSAEEATDDWDVAETTTFTPTVKPGETVKHSTDTREIWYSMGEAVGFTFLARLVREGKISETEALTIGCQVKPGKSAAYRAARDGLHKAMAELGTQYPPISPEQEATVKELKVAR